MKKTKRYKWNARRFLKNMSGVVAAVSFFMLYGTVGSSELGTISNGAFVVQASFYAVLLVVSLKVAGAFEPVEE